MNKNACRPSTCTGKGTKNALEKNIIALLSLAFWLVHFVLIYTAKFFVLKQIKSIKAHRRHKKVYLFGKCSIFYSYNELDIGIWFV